MASSSAIVLVLSFCSMADANLAEAAAGQESYFNQLPELHCRWHFTREQKEFQSGELLWGRDAFDATLSWLPAQRERLCFGGGLVQSSLRQHHVHSQGFVVPEARWSTRFPLHWLLVTLPPGEEGRPSYCTLPELLKHPGITASAIRSESLIVVTVKHHWMDLRVWINPAKSYCITKKEMVVRQTIQGDSSPTGAGSRITVTAWHELGNELWFPKSITVGGLFPHEVGGYQIEVTEAKRANGQRMEPFRFGPGERVLDMRVGKVMTAQADGSLVEDEKLTRGFQKSAEEQRLAPPPLRASLPTASEPWHWTAYILPGTAFVCGLLGLFWAIRWWQERREAA